MSDAQRRVPPSHLPKFPLHNKSCPLRAASLSTPNVAVPHRPREGKSTTSSAGCRQHMSTSLDACCTAPIVPHWRAPVGSSQSAGRTETSVRCSAPGRQLASASPTRYRLEWREAGGGFPSPLHRLRAVSTASREGGLNFEADVDELAVGPADTVRLGDVDGRVLHVRCGSVLNSPIAPLLAPGSICDGSCFTLHLLHDYMGPFSALTTSTPRSNCAATGSGGIARWYRYCTAATLYLALVDAGFCDRFCPLVSVQWVNWREMLQQQLHLRLDLLSNPPTRHMCCPYLGRSKSGKVPVAVSVPMTMKGKLRCTSASGGHPSISCSPFTDAEVFQLFYLQLVFRAAYDIFFDNMMLGDNADILRSDRIAVRTSGRHPLAFEHPVAPRKWLMFPPRSRILYFTCFDNAVIPRYAPIGHRRHETKQYLFGASMLTQCQGVIGRRVVTEWAVHRPVGGPEDALAALEELFGHFEQSFGATRASVWQSSVPPRIYRCGQSSFTRLWEDNDDLRAFLMCEPSPPKVECMTKCEPQQLNGEEKEGKVESVTRRWGQYVGSGDVSTFEGSVDHIRIVRFLGSGGTSLVYEGNYGPDNIPVAVKCFVIPCDMPHEEYVKESLTSVAFLTLLNQMERCGIGKYIHMYDFVISSTPPENMPAKDIATCTRVSDALSEQPKLCYLITTLMDGVIGRFLTEEDDDFDPCYDTLVNSPLCDGELFQFLYMQLALRALFDCTILDLMLNGQLRGDNLGFSWLLRTNVDKTPMPSYNGLIVIFQPDEHAERRYLRFPANRDPDTGADSPLRLINFIDFGQGKQPELQELTKRGLIGETIVESCIQDDGFGRYWPTDRLYSQYIVTCGSVARQAADWGAHVDVGTPEASEAAVKALFDIFAPTYGVDPQSEEELDGHIVFRWTPESVGRLRRDSKLIPGYMATSC